LSNEQLNIGVDILLELTNGFCAKSVRDGLAFAGVLCSVAGVEET
jgi:hypothetical protein